MLWHKMSTTKQNKLIIFGAFALSLIVIGMTSLNRALGR